MEASHRYRAQMRARKQKTNALEIRKYKMIKYYGGDLLKSIRLSWNMEVGR